MDHSLQLTTDQSAFVKYLAPAMLNPSRLQQAAAIHLTGKVSRTEIDDAVTNVVQRHEALRTVLREREGTWSQSIESDRSDVVVGEVFIRGYAADKIEPVLKVLLEELGQSVEFPENMVRMLIARNSSTAETHLLIAIHHAVCDRISLGTICSDLSQEILTGAQANMRPPEPLGYAQSVRLLHEYAHSAQLSKQYETLLNLPWDTYASVPKPNFLDRSLVIPNRTTHSWSVAVSRLGGTSNQCSKTLPRWLPQMAPIAHAITDLMGGQVPVEFVHNGRTLVKSGNSLQMDVNKLVFPRSFMRTVGWFALAGLLVLPRAAHSESERYLESFTIAAQALPNLGVSYGIFRNLDPTSSFVRDFERPQRIPGVWLNYVSTRSQRGTGSGSRWRSMPASRDALFAGTPLALHILANPETIEINCSFDPTLHGETFGKDLEQRVAELLMH